ncbi:MAG: AMP-binding protein [Acidobacteria bacterium]|nr:AMP-binding protein [Acidobacteriota bacterium]MCA1611811.1 AMP-binding protein [Acidobacteriota bacterium]
MAHYDKLETRDPAEREQALFAHLPDYLDHARERSPALARRLNGIPGADINDRDALARIPVLRKSELAELQRADPPFGRLAGVPLGQCGHVFSSPGPLFEPAARRADYGAFARPLFAAGFRPGDLVYNTFSYHFTPAGLMVDSAAQELGCAVFPAGVGQTELQVAAIAHLRPQGYAGTPSFLKILLDKAAETGADVASMTHGLVSAEALPSSLRAQFSAQGLRVLQCYTTAELGVIAYESEAMEGLIVNERLILEIVRPGTGEPLPDGEVGEIVVTNLASPEYPLVRFGTGDLSAVLPGASPCGRTNVRIRGWLGRADQSAKVRGMFVHPGLVARVVRRHPEIFRARLVVRRESDADEMTLRCETESPGGLALAEAIAASIRDVCQVRGEVELVAPGSLPNDGKVIDDTRPVT